MDVKDNRELMRKHREAKSEACRVCGSKEVHTIYYNGPTMKCVENFRAIIRLLEEEIAVLEN